MKELFDELVPKKGWLRDYVEFTRKTLESPTIFNFFAAVVLLGAILERNIFYQRGTYKIFPNFAVVFIAPTARCRKNLAIDEVKRLVLETNLVSIVERTTPERLIERLFHQERACALICAPELSYILGKREYLQGMIQCLTRLFDCPAHLPSDTVCRRTEVLKNVALSLLGGSTLEWFVKHLPMEAFEGGFMTRLLFIHLEDRDRFYPEPAAPNKVVEKTLRLKLEKFSRIKGEIHLSTSAKDWYSQWYLKHSKKLPPWKQLYGYHEKKPDWLIKLAMVFEIAEGKDSLVITLTKMQEALKILNYLEKGLPELYQRFYCTEVGEKHHAILGAIRREGGTIQHSKLLRMVQHSMSSAQLQDVVRTLCEAEYVKVDEKRKDGVWYKLIGGKNG